MIAGFNKATTIYSNEGTVLIVSQGVSVTGPAASFLEDLVATIGVNYNLTKPLAVRWNVDHTATDDIFDDLASGAIDMIAGVTAVGAQEHGTTRNMNFWGSPCRTYSTRECCRNS